jgi:hypothetical protein
MLQFDELTGIQQSLSIVVLTQLKDTNLHAIYIFSLNFSNSILNKNFITLFSIPPHY